MPGYSTYEQVGIAEDVADKISNISPTDTPFQSMAGKDKISNKVYEWQEDSLASPASKAEVEGADAGAGSSSPTTMRSNYSMIIEDVVRVSGSADAVKTYGRAKETAYQLAKKGKELKRDLEYHLVGVAQNATAGDSSTVPRLFGNLFGQDAGSVDMIDASVTNANGGVGRALSETLLLDVAQKTYSEGADPSMFMIKPADSLILADFANSAGRNREVGNSGKSITNVVNLYVSPFGEFKVTLNRWMLASEALLIDPSAIKLSTLRPWTRTTLAKTGDNTKHQMLAELGFKHTNYKSTGRITDLS